MKFSVLLPTRNGGRYLGDCISSILNQSYENMELIVSDNANMDDTPKIIASFSGDHRLKAIRNEKPVSVIENWNNALYASSGDYVLMIGDDDFLLPGYFKKLEETIEKYDQPEGITYNGYSFICPNAIDGNPHSYYSDPHFNFDSTLKKEGLLNPGVAHSIVRDMFDFNVRVPLNTLPHLWSRKVINRVEGDIFRPPYPDHFALNSLLLKAKSWVFIPEKLYIIGVTPKSYGHYVFSNDEQEKGSDYLGISTNFDGRLPGNDLVNNQYVWLMLLKENYKDHLEGVEISRANYVRRQVYFWYCQFKYGSTKFKELGKNFKKLAFLDWLGLISSAWDKKSLKTLGALIRLSKGIKVETFYYEPQVLKEISDIKEFAKWIRQKPSV